MSLPVADAGRALAERLMTDSVRIETVTRSNRPDPDTLEYTETVTLVWAGRCQVRWQSVQPRDATPSGQTITAQAAQLRLPFSSSAAVATGMRATITASQDPAMVGRTFRITGRFQQTHATARRFPVEEYT